MERVPYPTDCRAWPAVSCFEDAFPTLDWRTYSPPQMFGCAAYAGVIRLEVQPGSTGWVAFLRGPERSDRVYAADLQGLPFRTKLIEYARMLLDAAESAEDDDHESFMEFMREAYPREFDGGIFDGCTRNTPYNDVPPRHDARGETDDRSTCLPTPVISLA